MLLTRRDAGADAPGREELVCASACPLRWAFSAAWRRLLSHTTLGEGEELALCDVMMAAFSGWTWKEKNPTHERVIKEKDCK